ncbi:hypothetical protein CC77DRAFT_614584 [Alternaria alternata]|uniref:Uncharacterized protein n=1 Tax=Alternaria alternata TaxID=5599 RepID=A0A177DX83_ALTAL|nr:hypothetical protein CC77DRAFT_614584 [Alternaria alternata]OAG23602.1 hypothetical protein CC77DRAFT_614584 [Alternaria alternata]
MQSWNDRVVGTHFTNSHKENDPLLAMSRPKPILYGCRSALESLLVLARVMPKILIASKDANRLFGTESLGAKSNNEAPSCSYRIGRGVRIGRSWVSLCSFLWPFLMASSILDTFLGLHDRPQLKMKRMTFGVFYSKSCLIDCPLSRQHPCLLFSSGMSPENGVYRTWAVTPLP